MEAWKGSWRLSKVKIFLLQDTLYRDTDTGQTTDWEQPYQPAADRLGSFYFQSVLVLSSKLDFVMKILAILINHISDIKCRPFEQKLNYPNSFCFATYYSLMPFNLKVHQNGRISKGTRFSFYFEFMHTLPPKVLACTVCTEIFFLVKIWTSLSKIETKFLISIIFSTY